MFKNIFNLLSTKEKKKIILLIILTFIVAIIDMLGVASIFPFLSVLVNPTIVETNILLNYFYRILNNFGVNDIKQFLIVLGFLVFVFLVISFIFRIAVFYVQSRFSYMREHSIGKNLMEIYLSQPYVWYLSQHSSNLSKNILSEVTQVVHYAIFPFIQLISQGFAAIALTGFLFFLNPTIATITLLVLLIFYIIIFFITKNLLKRIGSDRIISNKDRFMSVKKAFESFKEIKLNGLEKVHLNVFSNSSKKYANNLSLSNIISGSPRYLIEILSFGGLIILILILLSRDIIFETFFPLIAIYAFTGYRLLPALQQIFFSISNLRSTKSSLDLLVNEFKKIKLYQQKPDCAPMLITKSISLNNVYFSYPNTKKRALKKINISIPAFSKIGIVGITGSGKTTLIDIILGLLDPSQGELIIDGNIINSDNKKSWQKSVGYVPQQIYLTDESVASNIAFIDNVLDIDHVALEEAAKIANLHEFIINELPEKYNTFIGEYGVRFSGGQRQRIGIARALYKKPQVLILDEATSSLDTLTEKYIVKELDRLKEKITTIFISHRLTTVKNCDIIFLLENGEIIDQGSYDELKVNSKVFKKFLEKKK